MRGALRTVGFHFISDKNCITNISGGWQELQTHSTALRKTFRSGENQVTTDWFLKWCEPLKFREIGGEVTNDGDFITFEGNNYRRGFLYKSFPMNAIVRFDFMPIFETKPYSTLFQIVDGVKPSLTELEKFQESADDLQKELETTTVREKGHSFAPGDVVEVCFRNFLRLNRISWNPQKLVKLQLSGRRRRIGEPEGQSGECGRREDHHDAGARGLEGRSSELRGAFSGNNCIFRSHSLWTRGNFGNSSKRATTSRFCPATMKAIRDWSWGSSPISSSSYPISAWMRWGLKLKKTAFS